MKLTYDIVICGAGIAGISTAYHLAVNHGIRNVLLVDERSPLSLTSDKSTECYRNWWPGPGDAMVGLMNRSIDLMEELAHESGNVFQLNRRGYLFLTADSESIPTLQGNAVEPSHLGAGPLRHHTGQAGDPFYRPSPPDVFTGQPTGADLILDLKLIRQHFPYISDRTIGALHIRRAGWFSAQQMGMYLLEKARAHGVSLTRAKVIRVGVDKERVHSVFLDDGGQIYTRSFVNAAGPYLKDVGKMIGLDLPVFCELHLKAAFKDHLGVVPRDAPVLIWNDPQVLPWTDEERGILAEDEETRRLNEPFPAGVHTRPEGGTDSQIILMLWEYHTTEIEPIWPPEMDPQYPEIALRGLAIMLPGLRAYFNKAPRPILDGGYYTKTRENRPLIGPLPVRGAYVIGALSGFGMMAACGAGELLAAHMAGGEIASYAPAFMLERYEDPAYQRKLESWGESGQL